MRHLRTHRIVVAVSLLLSLLSFFDCAKKAPPKTPDQVATDVLRGLAAHRPQVLWEALPPSYQKDVEALVRGFARKMDKDLWNKAFFLADKVLLVLKTKKALLLEGEMAKSSPVPKERLSANWNVAIETAEILTKSELADLDRLKRLDMGEFFAGTGAAFMEKLDALLKLEKDKKHRTVIQQLEGVKATLIRSQKDTATVRIQVPEQAVWDVDFVQVEHKWIPKPMAEQWKIKMDQAKKALAEFSTKLTPAEKQRILGMAATLDGILEQMRAAKTVRELEATMGEAFGMLLGTALGKG